MPTGPALLTDRYELTMVAAALADGTADRDCVFEVFARRLPHGRRYGVLAGTGRLLEALPDFRFTDEDLAALREQGLTDSRLLDWLAGFRFSGDVDGYAEGELFFPGSPVLTVRAPFAEGVLLETLVLSVLNHDSAIASAAARMVAAACERPCIEMGSRRTHEDAAVAAARAAYLVGFAATSNLEAGHRYGVPTTGTSAHAFTLLHDDEAAAFRAQVAALGVGTTLLVDTYDVDQGIRTAVEVAGPELGAIRLDSGDLPTLAAHARELLDSLGATGTRIIVTSDLDEFAIAGLMAAPVDGYGVGTSLVTGSGAPTAGMVYKLVARDGVPVAKRSEGKNSVGGRKSAVRRHDASGTATAEVVTSEPVLPRDGDRSLLVELVRGGELCAPATPREALAAARAHYERARDAMPAEAFALSRGDCAIETLTA
ncbi:nicotinate phosphoribosyltransferase [Geodermatophilus obscurus]|uniref:Nicotinate phosphoribosyltransferase n=1 Tax=Geodermatophilus obscurus (strain ATCC 25078 / DSM 43160 / JCM 3152 / CCUG 61914 / KCC A-0152 / KCTC 9177 / NBRC 13315 / NRRL B-3577 / G-20) TaxID=526225 RepID=D2SBE0_GEOOG|nr:nicotinate phosphoribosyltransferase [Geodermatophilus obscurus]ADB74088.1 nicotinate phosphoribosyltransferase [Geodermatophilus obscurus DSM 43160]